MTESETLHRSYPAELEVLDGRTIEGMAVPYGVAAEVEDNGRRYREAFEAGAFKRATRAPTRLELLVEHRDASPLDPVGLGLAFEEKPDGLFGTWRVYDGAVGDHVLERVKGGALRGLSVGFRPLGPGRREEDGTLVRTSCHLDEVSLTRSPAFARALVTAVRSRPPSELDEELRKSELDPELEARLRALGFER